jgi:putative addiction module component (TIGR02574 family)
MGAMPLVPLAFPVYHWFMPMTVEQIAAEALLLPGEARALLADQLVESLDGSVPTTRLDELWAVEARRRLAEVRSGHVQTISGEEAALRVRRAVGR